MTMGTAAHYTWRYRLWKGLEAAGTSVDFVGPIHTVFTYPGWQINSTEYRDPNFDTDHAAVSGMTLMRPAWTMSALAEKYRPDVIVSILGANDIIKNGTSVDELISTLSDQIHDARHVDPGVSVVLGQYGQTWVPGLNEYNSAIAELVDHLDRPTARVLLASAPVLNPAWDTFDGAHPTTSGEKKIAASVAQSLAELGLPSGPAPADPPEVNGEFAPVPTATATVHGIKLTWPEVDYAGSEDIWIQDTRTWTTTVRRYVMGTSADIGGIPGHTYRIWLAPVQAWAEIGTHSVPIVVTVPMS